MIPWAVIELLMWNPIMALKVIIIWIVIAVFRKIFEPKIIGSQTGLSPLLALFSIYVGMKISGVWGMILGPIIFQIFIRICQSGLFNGLIVDIKLFVNDCFVFNISLT